MPVSGQLEMSREGIPVRWDEGEVLPVKIRRSYDVEMFRRLHCIPLKTGSNQGYDGVTMSDNRPKAALGSSPGRQTT